MSGALAQNLAVALIVTGALAWLVLRRLRTRGKDAACENCPSAKPVAGMRPPPMPEVLLGIGEPHHATPSSAPERRAHREIP